MADDDDVREAVEKLGDKDRLIEGEDPRSTDPADAEHWVRVYGELLGFKDNLVGEAAATSAELTPSALPEAETDLTLLNAQRRRLEHRYRFWRRRLADLRSGGPEQERPAGTS